MTNDGRDCVCPYGGTRRRQSGAFEPRIHHERVGLSLGPSCVVLKLRTPQGLSLAAWCSGFMY